MYDSFFSKQNKKFKEKNDFFSPKKKINQPMVNINGENCLMNNNNNFIFLQKINSKKKNQTTFMYGKTTQKHHQSNDKFIYMENNTWIKCYMHQCMHTQTHTSLPFHISNRQKKKQNFWNIDEEMTNWNVFFIVVFFSIDDLWLVSGFRFRFFFWHCMHFFVHYISLNFFLISICILGWCQTQFFFCLVWGQQVIVLLLMIE